MYFSIRNEKIHKLNIITCRLQVRNSVGFRHFLSPHFSFFSKFVVKFLDLNEEGMAHETTTQKIRLVPAFWPHCTFLYTLRSWCFLFYFICSHVYINSRFSWDGLYNQPATPHQSKSWLMHGDLSHPSVACVATHGTVARGRGDTPTPVARLVGDRPLCHRAPALHCLGIYL